MLRFMKSVLRTILRLIYLVPVSRNKLRISCMTSVVFGICLGVTLDMLSVLYQEGKCQLDTLPSLSMPSMRYLQQQIRERGGHTAGETNETRPYHVSEELGIKEKLFVAVLTNSSSVTTLGVAMDMTLAKHVTDVVYFSTGKPSVVPDGLQLFEYSDSEPGVLPIHILRYIKDNLTSEYDFYLFVSDRTYLRASRYFKLVQYISVKEYIYMGVPGTDRNFCLLEGGALISFSIMSNIFSKLDECSRYADRNNPSITLGQCVYYASQKSCTSKGGDWTLKYYELKDFDYETDIDKLNNVNDFNKALIIYPVPDDETHYKLHRYFCKKDLEEIESKIEAVKAEVIDSGKFDADTFDILTWPLGAQPSHKPADPFHVLPWIYFTESLIYFDNEHENLNNIAAVDKRDLDDLRNVINENLKKKFNSRYQMKKLINGYRRFDPTRGMEYILDLHLLDRTKKDFEIFRRFHLLRPLGDVELIPMPNLDETATINIVVPLKPEDVGLFDVFIITYAASCLQSKDNVTLLVAFLEGNSSKTGIHDEDPFSRPKTMISNYIMKYNQKGKLKWTALTGVKSDIGLIDRLENEFDTDALIFLTTVNTEMSINLTNLFLERVRLNTIKQTQVFFPIAFQQYQPNIIYDKKPFPSTIRLSQRLGFLNIEARDHSSFYLSDYQTARTEISNNVTDIFSMFVKFKKFHVLRASEPNLKLRWMNNTCDKTIVREKYQECMTERVKGLATQRHLALLLYEQITEQASNSSKVKLQDLIRHW